MNEIKLTFTDYRTLEEIKNIQKKTKKGDREPGIYVLCPFSNPYYVGIATANKKTGYWVPTRVRNHVNTIKGDTCKYVIFSEDFYRANEIKRKTMIPRKADPTKPEIVFDQFAKEKVLFWRVKEPRFISEELLSNPMGTVGDVKNPLYGEIKAVVNKAFSDKDFRFIFLDSSTLDSHEKLKCIETIVKFSLKHNTVSASYCIHEIPFLLKALGISKIKIQCPNPTIKALFYDCPHDENHNLVGSLQGIVEIVY